MTIVTVKKDEDIKDPKIVERDVRESFKLLADSQGIKLKESDYPNVKIDPNAKNSRYTFKNKSIIIRPDEIATGDTYFEEASHALRDLVQERKGVSGEYQDRKIHEFVGRGGETLGRELVKGTDLEYLFKDHSPRDMTNPKTKKKWLDNLLKIRKDKNLVKRMKKESGEPRALLRKGIESNYSELNNILYDYQGGKLDFDEFYKKCSHLLNDYKEKVNNNLDIIGLYEPDGKNIITSNSDYTFLVRSLKKIKDLPEIKREKELDEIVNNIKEHYNYGASSLKFDSEDLVLMNAEQDIAKREKSHFVHRKPYLYAQQYSPEELKGIYEKSDSEIKKEFFKRKQPTLEKAVSASLIILMPVLIMQLVLNMRLTGFVLGINPVGTSILGIIVFFMLITLIYFEVRFRRKK
jgi:hypothetical protein